MRRRRRTGGGPHHVMHPAQRERGLISRLEPSAAQTVTVPTEFIQRPGQQRQRTQRPAVVVQLGAMPGHPADQPDIDFVVTVQPGEPTVVGGHTARRDDLVVAAAEHVVSGSVGDVQQVGQPQPGGTGDRSQTRGPDRTGSATRSAETIEEAPERTGVLRAAECPISRLLLRPFRPASSPRLGPTTLPKPGSLYHGRQCCID